VFFQSFWAVGAVISSLVSYALEKKISNAPGRIWQGAIEGVAGLNPPTMPPQAPPSFPCSPWASEQCLDCHDFRLSAHPRGEARAIPDRRTSRCLLGCESLPGYLGNVMLIILNLPLVGIWCRCSGCLTAFSRPWWSYSIIRGPTASPSGLRSLHLDRVVFLATCFVSSTFEAGPLPLAFMTRSHDREFDAAIVAHFRRKISIFISRPSRCHGGYVPLLCHGPDSLGPFAVRRKCPKIRNGLIGRLIKFI